MDVEHPRFLVGMVVLFTILLITFSLQLSAFLSAQADQQVEEDSAETVIEESEH